MNLILIAGLCLLLPGCFALAPYEESAANARLLDERGKIAKLYRECLEQNRADPAKAKANCEHYTQALYSLDVRGVR